jgi:hypothetical protein
MIGTRKGGNDAGSDITSSRLAAIIQALALLNAGKSLFPQLEVFIAQLAELQRVSNNKGLQI